MPNSLTASGITTATRTELIDQQTVAYEQIYGADINLESDTPDGQILNVEIQAVVDIEDVVVQTYNSFDPDNAIGTILDQRCAINGIQRQAGTFTTTNITITTNQSVNLYGLDQAIQPVFTVADSAGNQWELITTQLGVSTGSNVFLFQASVPGQVLTVPNTITIPVTIVLGVTAINNPTTYATLGINEESDAALKIRRRKSVSLQSQGYFQALIGALENINGVTSAFVIENTSSGTDSDGIPGHSIWVIVAGTPAAPLSVAWNSATVYKYGDIASSAGINYISVQNNNLNNVVSDTAFWEIYNPVAEAIYNYRNAGCGMYASGDAGAESYTIIQIDGSGFPVYWDSVLQEDLYIKFTASSLNGINPPNITGIVTYLVSNLVPGVFEEVNINQLGTLVQQVDSNTLVTSSGFSTSAGGSYTNTLTPAAKNKQFDVQAGNIIILPIILSSPGCSYTFTLTGGAYQVQHTNATVVHGGNTIQFTAIGGRATYTYSMMSGAGSVNSSTGLYTSAGIGTDVVEVTDGLSNTATCTVTVT